MISLIWGIKEKATNEPIKTNSGTDNKIVVTRGEEGWEKVKEGKGSQIQGDGRRLGFGW